MRKIKKIKIINQKKSEENNEKINQHDRDTSDSCMCVVFKGQF